MVHEQMLFIFLRHYS